MRSLSALDIVRDLVANHDTAVMQANARIAELEADLDAERARADAAEAHALALEQERDALRDRLDERREAGRRDP